MGWTRRLYRIVIIIIIHTAYNFTSPLTDEDREVVNANRAI